MYTILCYTIIQYDVLFHSLRVMSRRLQITNIHMNTYLTFPRDYVCVRIIRWHNNQAMIIRIVRCDAIWWYIIWYGTIRCDTVWHNIVCVCMCVYIYICIYMYTYTCVCIYIYIYIYIEICIYVCVHTAHVYGHFHTKNCQTKNLWVKVPKSLR